MGLQFTQEKIQMCNDKDILKLVEEMNGSCSVAIDSLNDLLLHEKMEANKLSLNIEEICMDDFIFNNVKLFQSQVLHFIYIHTC
jgi:hypothetical protein